MNKEQNIIEIEKKHKDKRTNYTLSYLIHNYNYFSEEMKKNMRGMDYWREIAKRDYDVDIANDRSVN